MMDDDSKLASAYELNGPDEVRRLYAAWAETYDAEFLQGQGYLMPAHVADAFVAAGGVGPVLDVGAGTGVMGEGLRAAGIGPVDALDLSPEMLAVAGRKGIYRHLVEADVTLPIVLPEGPYAGVVSSGTFTLGHVGPEAFGPLMEAAAPGAVFSLGMNAKHYVAAGFEAAFEAMAGRITGFARSTVPLYREGATGPHARDSGYVVVFTKV
jgi:SAM-dependent methyltransferase